MNKLLLTLLVPVLGVLPAVAQSQSTPRTQANPSLETQVERAVSQAAAKQPKNHCTCAEGTESAELSLAELIAAEEELMAIRNRDVNATFEKYPYLLNPAYRRNGKTSEKPASCTCPTKEQEPLSPQELIEAEEELSGLRSRLDPNATFEKYPYLLEPTYRRASEDAKQSIRRPYTQVIWAQKVGI